MTNLQVNHSSSDSSSGSSSDSGSGSSGTSSSSSGTGSSSSDSDSSVVEEAPKPDSNVAPHATLRPQPAPPHLTPHTNTQSKSLQNNVAKNESDKSLRVNNKIVKIDKCVNINQIISSSEEDLTNKVLEPRKLPPRRRSSAYAKTKNSASMAAKTGRLLARPTATRNGKSPGTKTSSQSSSKTDSKGPIKKKSIFSPDNSSESELEENKNKVQKPAAKTVTTPTRPKGRPRKASSEKTKVQTVLTILNDKNKDKNIINNKPKRRTSARTSGPPAKTNKSDVKEKNRTSSKSYTTSCSSADSAGGSSANESDLETANDGMEVKKEKVEVRSEHFLRTSKVKVNQKSVKVSETNGIAKLPPVKVKTEAEKTELQDDKPNMTRKLTRSLSQRKSKLVGRHLIMSAASLGAAGLPFNTETDSDPDLLNDKRLTSSSPVKRGPFSTKGPPVRKQPPPAAPRSPLAPPPPPEQRRCPVRACDSLGHLSGRAERHFTMEACPTYHNMTAKQCVEAERERVEAVEARRKAYGQRRAHPSTDQRAYQLKVKEMRTKPKVEVKEEKSDENSIENAPAEVIDDKFVDREPKLEGFVPDYDLKLFREAQANAAHQVEDELKNLPASRGTRYVVMGRFCMEVWYQSPYPADAARLPKLFLCEFCLNHHKTSAGIERHRAKCVWRHPPGDEVYRKGKLGVWQVDGRRHKQYCQQLCLLAKFFLDHKTLYYDVEPFLFYVMTLADADGCHTVGYFSKEKNSFLNYNVSCILTLPPYQRQGYGRLLIDFSYLLTRTEGKIGSPEKPLSDLGLISYRSYWKDVLLERLCTAQGNALSIRDMSQELAINSYDIVSTLQWLGMMKYWKGKHIILKRQELLDEYAEKMRVRSVQGGAGSSSVRQVDPACLRWTPYSPPPANAAPPAPPAPPPPAPPR